MKKAPKAPKQVLNLLFAPFIKKNLSEGEKAP